MECKLTDIIIKLGLEETALSYFEGASFTMMPHYHKAIRAVSAFKACFAVSNMGSIYYAL